METLASLTERIKTTGDIRSIVRTMKAPSAISIRQYEQAEKAIAAYEGVIDTALAVLLPEGRGQGRWGFAQQGPHAPRKALIVIGSDRGLCSRYNDIVLRHAEGRLRGGGVLAVIGARLSAAGHTIDQVFQLPSSVAQMSASVGAVIIQIEHWTAQERVGAVDLVHNRRVGRALAVPTERALLPMSDSDIDRVVQDGWPGRALPFFRMKPDALWFLLIRQRLFVLLYRALAEARESEHATRLAAMQGAERNIEDRGARR